MLEPQTNYPLVDVLNLEAHRVARFSHPFLLPLFREEEWFFITIIIIICIFFFAEPKVSASSRAASSTDHAFERNAAIID